MAGRGASEFSEDQLAKRCRIRDDDDSDTEGCRSSQAVSSSRGANANALPRATSSDMDTSDGQAAATGAAAAAAGFSGRSAVGARIDPVRLVAVTWNVAELQRSAVAPGTWTVAQTVQKVVQPLRGADVVCLQEWPDAATCERLFGSDFHVSQPARSHCGLAICMLRRSVFASVVQHPLPELSGVALVSATTVQGLTVHVASVHNLPFKENAQGRLRQMIALLLHIKSLTPAPLLICGDFNMRKEEDKTLLQLGLLDCFEQAGSPPTAAFTWDSRRNKFHSDGFPFTCRFDRVYFKNTDKPGVRAAIFPEGPLQLVGAEPASPTPGHYISDHYGLRQSFSLASLA
eukprot:m.86729 g.86729  ORF g.86729 m.86729 type:complete len:345 (-) comp15106_c0_seq1:2222-3256(-)